MAFLKKFTEEEVLNALAFLVRQSLPENSKDRIILSFNDDFEVEVYITEDKSKEELS